MKADYIKDKYKVVGVQLIMTPTEKVIIISALQSNLKSEKEYLKFYSDSENKSFFEDEGTDYLQQIDKCNAKISQIENMLTEMQH